MCFLKLSQDDIVEYVILHITKYFDSVSDFSAKPIIWVMLMV